MTSSDGSFILLRGGLIFDCARSKAGRADVLINGDTISQVAATIIDLPDECQVIDVSNRLLHPGLINAHTHGHGSLAKGQGDRWTLELLLHSSLWNGRERVAEDRYLSTKLGALEMVLKGTTACYDLNSEFPAPTAEGIDLVGRAYADVGMRAVIAPMVSDISFYDAIPGLRDALPEGFLPAPQATSYEAAIANIKAAVTKWSYESAGVRLAVAPTIPLHCSDEFIRACVTLARDHGLGLHSHVSESKIQAVSGLARYGQSLTAHMRDLGALGPRFTVAHGVWLDDEDMDMLGAAGASVAHNPGSNMRLGSGIADARGMLDKGVNLALGTDGPNCSDNQNMYEAMRLASLVSKVRTPDYETWLTTGEAFRAATTGGAYSLGLEGSTGLISAGYKADIVMLDLHHVNYLPMNNIVNQLVHVEDGTAVEAVMIGGRMIVWDRRVIGVDMPRLAQQVEAARARLEASTQEMRHVAEKLEPYVGRFCVGLARSAFHINRFASCETCSPGGRKLMAEGCPN